MANEIQTKLNAWANFTITLASTAAGAARQSTVVANTGAAARRRAAKILLKYRNGAVAPTAGRIVECFLFEGDDSGNRDDQLGASDATVTTLLINSYLLGALTVQNAATGTTPGAISMRIWDTVPMGELGTEFGIVVRNGTDQTSDVTENNYAKRHAPYLPEIQ